MTPTPTNLKFSRIKSPNYQYKKNTGVQTDEMDAIHMQCQTCLTRVMSELNSHSKVKITEELQKVNLSDS